MASKTWCSVVAILLTSVTAWPVSAAEDVESVSKDLTVLFRSARKVISDYQDKINDPNLGDKGLAAANVIEFTKANYKQAAGKDLSLKDDGSAPAKARIAMMEAVKQVMDEAQSMINEKGKGFKGFLPAVFGARVAGKFSTAMAGKYTIKLTAPKAWVRNRANRPDEWEDKVIETMFKQPNYEKGKAYAEETKVGGKIAYRYILPEYYGQSCLACHGEPRGATDISGGKKEGGKVGDLGGAISLTVFK